ncbi:NAD(P)-binding protein [Mycena maculata]|uniref:D-xylose 1-dehydrogenase (NADP(+), D-xylono-1,5-lactone-forming) n=1 Tax=Mycena maculata TaxID=230809 RepID=A0AAD7JVD3_9AGAR|nr:NAD(P)-binding protein [Mycena maculata]
MFGLLSRLYYMSNPPKTHQAQANSPLKTLNFGCLGAAKIAPGVLIDPSPRDAKRAKKFAEEHGFQKSYGGDTGYQDMIDDPEVDVIYNPLPNLHFEWTMKALNGGKHVLLEKPATDRAEEAAQIFSLAASKNLVVLEAFHYRFHPAIQRVKAILESKELGAIKNITVALTAPAGTAKDGDIRWSYELGGGSTMDPGCYTVNVLRYLASSSSPTAVLTAFAVPYSPRPQHKKVDKMFPATLALENGIFGELHSNLSEPKLFGIIPRIPKLTATVRCESGTVEIFNFLIPSYYHYITVAPSGKPRRVEKSYSFHGVAKGEDWWTTYRFQMEAFVDKIQGRTPQTWLEPQDTIDNMKWIEEIYAKDGFGSRPPSKYVYREDEK